MHQQTDSYPLTASQLAIWTGQSLQPNEPLYNMALAFRIDGTVDVSAFAESFRRVVADCDALRAVFRNVDGLPRQVFLDDAPASLEVIERGRVGTRDEQLEQWLKERTRRNFDVSQCLYDSMLLHSTYGSVWYLNQHHLITDAWSVSVIFHRMAEYYAALVAGEEPVIGRAPAFSKQIAREAAQSGSKLHAAADRYWSDRLERPVPLPRFYRDIPPTRGATTLRRAIDVDAAASEKIRQLPRQPEFAALTEDLGRFQVFCTVLAAYLWRVCGSDSLAIGTPSLNRSSQRLKQMAGLMIEMFPVQLDAAPGDTFRSLYAKVADSTRGMLMHSPPGLADPRHNRAFNVVLNYINASFGDFAGLKVRSEWIHPDCGDRNHLLRMQVHDFDQSGNFEVFLDLNSDAFDDQEREWAGRHFLRLLHAFVADPDRTIASVGLTTKGEAGWPQAAPAAAAPPANVIDAFVAQSVMTPSATALIDGEVSWSYAELANAARDVQRQLQEVQQDNASPVAVMMQRSPELVAAVLGTMLARRPYVPIDPDYPADRVAWVVADSGAELVLTSPGLTAAGLPAGVQQLELGVDSDACNEALPLQSGICPEDTAYIIYTSGSTGRPKGVLVSHGSLAHYIDWAASYYFDGQALGMALFSSIAFDLTVTSMFTPLVCGGHTVIYRESAEAGDIVIRRVVEDNRVDIIKLTPAHLSLLQAMDLSQSRIKTLIVGGEDLKTGLAKTISNYFDGAVKIYNEYGPTEATVACMIHRFDPVTDRDISVPIGHAIDHARIYVLDTGLNPQPRGVAGQIFIGGAGVAAGYLNRPELSAEKFIADPFEDRGRMYATGDLGRWDEQGRLRFMGRLDDQVKIRGVRVEPGEIEAVMKDHPDIDECVVVARSRSMAGMSADESFCTRCGLEGRHPQAELDAEGVCRICRQFEREQHIASAYFRTMDELTALVDKIKARASGKYDSMMLLSGGKDSTYALCRLVDLGLRPLVFTLDNGYISAGAKQNMQRVVDRLGLDLVIGNTPAMNAIFADSLKRFSNVCEGCFKTIYTLGTKLASEHGINHIFTGLSRGQIFQTRVADLVRQKITDPQQIDRQIIEARKAYHRLDDVISRSLDVSLFERDDVFEQIQFVDFYRYCDVSLGEVYEYLGTRAPWVRPADTGRSTNCLINEAGIYVHKVQRGHHNYSLPYSWDVRLGHKERDAARQELDDDIDEQNVRRILGEVGYVPDLDPAEFNTDTYLTAYYTGTAVGDAELQQHLTERLPGEYVPRFFVHLDAMPLTANGKLDRASLPEPVTSSARRTTPYAAPETTTEKVLARIWSNVLGVDNAGIDDNFFDLGGDSILNIQIVARARKYGLELSPQLIFDKPTIRELAAAALHSGGAAVDQRRVAGTAPLTPVQQRLLEQGGLEACRHYCQTAILELDVEISQPMVADALALLVDQHAALSANFIAAGDNSWCQVYGSPGDNACQLDTLVAPSFGSEARQASLAHALESLAGSVAPDEGRNIHAAYLPSDGASRPLLLLAVHHLVVDGVSWWIMLEDLEQIFDDLRAARKPLLGARSTSFKDWAEWLARRAGAGVGRTVREAWLTPQKTNAETQSTSGERGEVRCALSRKQTLPLMRTVAGRLKVQMPELLLGAAAECVAQLLAVDVLQVDIEGHGREALDSEADLLRTVGWFTTIYPLAIPIDNSLPVADRVVAVKHQIRAVPNSGIDYGLLRYLAEPATRNAVKAAWGQSPFLMNYLGQWSSSPADARSVRFLGPIGLSAAPAMRATYPLELNAVIFDGELIMEWNYDRLRFPGAAVDACMRATCEALEALAAQPFARQEVALTPDDYPSSGLSQQDLDAVLEEFGE